MEDPAWSQGPLSSRLSPPPGLTEAILPLGGHLRRMSWPDSSGWCCSDGLFCYFDQQWWSRPPLCSFSPRTPESLNMLVNMLQIKAGCVKRAKSHLPSFKSYLPRAPPNHAFPQRQPGNAVIVKGQLEIVCLSYFYSKWKRNQSLKRKT